MRSLSLSIAAALSLATSVASANSVTLVATTPTTVAPGGTIAFHAVYQLDPNVTGAVFQVDSSNSGVAAFTVGTNNMTGTNGFTSGFSLRNLAFVETPGVICAGSGISVTCNGPGSQAAGNAGGLSGATFNAGTYTVGTYTLRAGNVGTSTIAIRIRVGFEWLDGNFNNLPNPTSNVLQINVVPEPATVALIGIGLVGLALLSRESSFQR